MNPGVVSSEEFELKNVAESTGSNILSLKLISYTHFSPKDFPEYALWS